MNIRLSSTLKSYANSYNGLTKLCWQGILISLVESAFIGVYNFLSLYFVHDLHFDVVTSSSIISFYGVGAILGGYLGGKLSDRFSSGMISVVSLFLQSAVLLILVKITSASYLAVLLFFMGLASYGFITSNYLWVLAQCDTEHQRLKALSLLGVGSNLGLGLAALLVSSFAYIGFTTILFISGIFLLLSAMYFSFLKSSNKKMVDEQQALSEEKTLTRMDKKILWLVLFSVFLAGLIVFQTCSTYSIYIQKTFPEFGIKGVGFLFAMNCFLVCFFQAPITDWFNHYNKLVMVGVGAFLLGFGMLMLNLSSLFWVAILGCIVNTIGEMLFFSVAQFICYRNSPQDKKGHTMGMYRMIYASSRIVAPAGGGFIYQYWGASILWWLCGLVGLLSLGACFYFKKYD